MIRINLASKKQPASISAGSGGLKDFLAKLSEGKQLDLGRLLALKDSLPSALPITKILTYLGIAALGWFSESYYKDLKIRELDEQIAQHTAEKDRLTESANKLKDYEEMKKALEADEAMIRNKIDAIHKLIVKRGEPVKTLLAFSHAIPEEVWLSDFVITNGEIAIRGNATKFEKISDFMKSLGENDFFTDLVLKSTEMSKDTAKMNTPSFEVSLKLKRQ